MKAATRRTGKPYIWATWLAGILGGKRCVWAAWFKSHFQYQKYEEMASDLVRWNAEHTVLMQARRRELEREGYVVTEESQNAFKVEGTVAVLAGKPDLIARKPGMALIVDGKTGRARDSDIHQALIYLYAVPKQFPMLMSADLEGEVQYKRGDQRITVTAADLSPEYMGRLIDAIKVIGGPDAPAREPSRDECRFCNIGAWDCPQRVGETVAVHEAAF